MTECIICWRFPGDLRCVPYASQHTLESRLTSKSRKTYVLSDSRPTPPPFSSLLSLDHVSMPVTAIASTLCLIRAVFRDPSLPRFVLCTAAQGRSIAKPSQPGDISGIQSRCHTSRRNGPPLRFAKSVVLVVHALRSALFLILVSFLSTFNVQQVQTRRYSDTYGLFPPPDYLPPPFLRLLQ